MRILPQIVALFLASMDAFAQPATFDSSTRIFRLDGGGVSYAFGVNRRGELQQIYWGARLATGDRFPEPTPVDATDFDTSYTNTPQEYPSWGAGLFIEPALKVSFSDGNRDLVLHYASHRTTPDGVDVVLKDITREIFVTLHYSMDPGSGVLARSATVENRESRSVLVEQVAAAAWSLPPLHSIGGPAPGLSSWSGYTLNYLTGRPVGEWNLTQERLDPGARVIESRRGSTGHQANPWFAIQAGESSEDHGEVWFGSLAWSGSWRIVIERDHLDAVHITGGFNPFDFGYLLQPNQKLETPVWYGGYAAHGLGEASRIQHRHQLAHILPHRNGVGEGARPKPRPVIYNSWEATNYRVNEAGQIALAEKAAILGVDRFVMDDGWFGQRKDDHAGLGDWYVNSQKFPHGLKPLIDKVRSLGMDFGLWVEPEMVNADSDLYRKHPDWVLNFPGRPRSEMRNQFVLNLARADVRAFVFGVLDKLLDENEIAFLKWDYNRNWSEPGWDQVSAAEQKKVYVEYTRSLYSILAELERKHPTVEIESCSSGGGRVDLGILQYADEVWPSDNTDPFDRLTLQDGFTYAYTPQIMMAWVTDSPHWFNHRSTSLSYRLLSAMQGSLGIGANLTKWNDAEIATAKRLIAAYHQVQSTITQGDLYRLVSPRDGSEFSATQTVNPDASQSVIFAFIHSTQQHIGLPRLKLKGLDPAAQYALRPIEGAAAKDVPAAASGAWWMNHGFDLSEIHGVDLSEDFIGDFQAAAFRLDRE